VTPSDGITCPADLAAAVAALRPARRVAVVGHVNPEPDCIGSTLGATLALRGAGLQAQPFNADPVPESLRFLPGAEEMVPATRLPEGLGDLLFRRGEQQPLRLAPELGGVFEVGCEFGHRRIARAVTTEDFISASAEGGEKPA